jgi:Mg-chelatase subunit ChlD
MQDRTSAGRTKLEAAVAAADAFVALLALEDSPGGRDRAAVVTFNSVADTVTGLGYDRAELSAALRRLSSGAGTRIDLGLLRAEEALNEGGPSANLPVVILLTDGIPTGTTSEAVNAAARSVRDRAGAVVFAIGLGSDVDRALLAQIADDRDRVVLAPDGEDLAHIYGDIARELPCIVR